jgi:hypothetical protein
MSEQTVHELIKRLRWWDAYFNEPDKVKKFVNDHPLYRDNPTAFDETAVELDIREAADALARLTEGRRIEGIAWKHPDAGWDFIEGGRPLEGEWSATLILHDEPRSGSET